MDLGKTELSEDWKDWALSSEQWENTIRQSLSDEAITMPLVC